jgi:hypothetical protein
MLSIARTYGLNMMISTFFFPSKYVNLGSFKKTSFLQVVAFFICHQVTKFHHKKKVGSIVAY